MKIYLAQNKRDEKCFEQMEQQIDSVIAEIKELRDVGNYLEDVLDISRKQNLLNGSWETEYYELCLAWGGPGIWLRTDGIIKGAWWGDYLEVRVDDKTFISKLEEIEEYLDDIYC